MAREKMGRLAGLDRTQLHSLTKTRKFWALSSSFFLAIAVIFLILVEVGQTSKHTLPNVYFLDLDLSSIVPNSVPNSILINSIAQSLGLHDSYHVGLWNFCAEDIGEGIVYCSKPKTLYWFNPIAVIQGELLAGASITFPQEVVDILHILRVASQWMFALFLTGACLDFVMIFITPLALYSKLASLVVAPLTFAAALFTTVATVLATVIFVIFRNAARSQTELNIGASLGKEMFAFMWIATAFSLFAFIIQLSLCCCCRSRRKVKKEYAREHNGERPSADKESA